MYVTLLFFNLASHFLYLHADYRYFIYFFSPIPTSLKACIRCFTWFLWSTASMASQTVICCFWYFCILWYFSIVHQFFFLIVLNSGIYSGFLYRNVSSSFVSLLMLNTQLALVLPMTSSISVHHLFFIMIGFIWFSLCHLGMSMLSFEFPYPWRLSFQLLN